MAFVDKYPYTDFHELNLDWILKKIKEVDKTVNDFTVFNKLTWAGVWSAAKSYVKWSIVQDENGNGYISIQPVPLNVPLTNTDYWQQIAKYEELYAAFDQRINAAQASADNAQNSANSAQNSANSAQTTADTGVILGSQFFRTAKTILIGDSYAGESASIGSSWATDFCNIAGKNCIISAIGGAGFTVNGYPTFLQLLQNVANENTDAKIIIVMGGYNEQAHGDVNNIQGAIAEFMNYVKSTFPEATVFIGMCGSSAQNPPVNLTSTYNFYKSGAVSNGACYLNGIETVLFGKRFFNPDGIHPNPDGNREIAEWIYSIILGGAPSADFNIQRLNITLNDGFSLDTISNNGINIERTNDNILISDILPRIGVPNIPVQNLTPTADFITLGNYDTSYFIGAALSNPPVTTRDCIIQVEKNGETKFRRGQYNLYFNDGTLQLRLIGWSEEDVDWVNGTLTAILPLAYITQTFNIHKFR